MRFSREYKTLRENRYAVACVICLTALSMAALAQNTAAGGDSAELKHWSADQLKDGTPGLLLMTRTHLLKLVRVAAEEVPESHEGTTDVFFVEAGSGSILAGGEWEGANPLPDMPGERRGGSIKGGHSYELKPGAMINIPPSTPYMLRKGADGLTLVQMRINVGMHPWSLASTQQATLRTGLSIPLNSDQGQIVYWSAETLQRGHEGLAKIAAAGGSVADPRDFVAIPFTRTHAYNFMYRIMGKDGQPPGVEFHPGNSEVYFVVGGSATLMTGGEIENRAKIAARPGEENGTRIRNGTGFSMKRGDVVNVPPLTPHQSLPDSGGYSYMLIKVNTGTYPWSLTEK